MNDAGREDDTTPSSVDAELATLRDRFSLMDDIDRRNSEMFERFAAALRGTAEARAKATLDISASITAIETTLQRDRQAHQSTLAHLHEEIASARERMHLVVESLASLGSHVSGLTARVAPEPVRSEAASEQAILDPLPPSQAWTVVFHDVHDPDLAMSLQRHLASLPGVLAALSQAFDAGEARFDVRARRELSAGDFTGWRDGELRITDAGEHELHLSVMPAGPTAAHVGSPS